MPSVLVHYLDTKVVLNPIWLIMVLFFQVYPISKVEYKVIDGENEFTVNLDFKPFQII